MEDQQAPAESVRAHQAAMLVLSTPCKEVGPVKIVSSCSETATAVSEHGEGWVPVTHKKVQAAKTANLGNPSVPTPSSKGVSIPNPAKGKGTLNKSVSKTQTSSSRPDRAGPPSLKAKTWYDPDDRDLERGSRADRTVRVVLPSDVRNATRSTFIDHVAGVVGLHALEACGPSAAPNIWLLTFTSKDARGAFVRAGDFVTKDGHSAKVAGKDPAKFWIKIHWVPYQVPMVNALRQLDATEGVKIIAASYDKVTGHEGLQHVRSLLRTVLIEAPDASKVPYALQWSHEGLSGQALVTMKGRAPVCLRCHDKGHVRRECQAVKCTVCLQWGHNDPHCTIRPGWTSIVRNRPTFDDAADVVGEDMDVIAPAATGENSAVSTRDISVLQTLVVVGPSRPIDPIDSALGARDTSAQPVVREDPGVGSWAESMDAEDGLPAALKPVSPMSAATSSGNSGGETSDESVTYESPTDGSVSSAGSKKNSKQRRQIKRERDRLGSTQSASPLAKKK